MPIITVHRLFSIVKSRSLLNIPPKMKLGKHVYFGSHVKLDEIADGALISIGDYSTITAGTTILVHDASSRSRTGMTYVAPVKIGKRVFIGIHSIILPGVTIGDDAVVAAGSVVTNDVEEGAIVAGVPARKIALTEALDKKRIELSEKVDILDYEFYDKQHPIDAIKVEEMVISADKNGCFFIK